MAWWRQVSLRWECAASRTGGQAAMMPVAGRGPLWQAAWPRERPCRLDPGDRVVNLQARPHCGKFADTRPLLQGGDRCNADRAGSSSGLHACPSLQALLLVCAYAFVWMELIVDEYRWS